MRDVLLNEAKVFNFSFTENMLVKFEQYYELLIEWNQKMNLTTIIKKEDVAVKHFIDSVIPADLILKGAKVADVGTGAGFPGVPLKIYRKDICLTLIDSLKKRITFLENVCDKLQLENTSCRHVRAEEAGKSFLRESFDVVCSRAVARLNVLCEYCMPLVKIGGIFIAYKGKIEDELKEAMCAIKELGGVLEDVKEVKLCDMDRTLITIRKKSTTMGKYPRIPAKIKTAPLL